MKLTYNIWLEKLFYINRLTADYFFYVDEKFTGANKVSLVLDRRTGAHRED
jgi:hypothetical protein